MIIRGSTEWTQFVTNLKTSKSRSNRDVFCLECWKIFKYEENKLHKLCFPNHKRLILTSKHFCTENKFIALARLMNKIVNDNEVEMFVNPYETQI